MTMAAGTPNRLPSYSNCANASGTLGTGRPPESVFAMSSLASVVTSGLAGVVLITRG